jgi:hypothetical protein
LTGPAGGGRKGYPSFLYIREGPMANHLTPGELADQLRMNQQEVIGRCVEMGVPIYHGRIDRVLFESSLRNLSAAKKGKFATEPRL